MEKILTSDGLKKDENFHCVSSEHGAVKYQAILPRTVFVLHLTTGSDVQNLNHLSKSIAKPNNILCINLESAA